MRELRNVIERALILETTSEIQSSSLPDFQFETRLQKTTSPQADPANRSTTRWRAWSGN